MVIAANIQCLFETATKVRKLTLPVYKENELKLTYSEDIDHVVEYSGKQLSLPFEATPLFTASISDWRRLTAQSDDCKPVYEVSFNIEDQNIEFHPGDTIGVIPENDESDVIFILEHLNLTSEADRCYKLSAETGSQSTKIPVHVPIAATLRHVLKYCVDFRSILKKLFLLALSQHTKDETERKVLQYLCSKEGSTMYTVHILKQNYCLLDIFNTFPSCKPPIEVLLYNLPRLLPRPYSIANSQLANKNTLKICFSVMNLANNRKGLTTSMLEKLITDETIENGISNLSLDEFGESKSGVGKKVSIYLRKNFSGFSAPEDLSRPLLLVGPGTGVAPFIGFLEERSLLKKGNVDLELGDTWLLFGCRNPELDYIYEEELKGFLADGILTRLDTAFSRIENDGVKYVQDIIKKNSKEIVEFLQNSAAVYVCGDLRTMAVQVKEALTDCIVEHLSKTQDEAKKYIARMEQSGRYFVDIWS